MKEPEEEKIQEFSFKNLFVPLTTFKAIHWIVIVGFLVYGNMLFNGFVWDDKAYLLFNPVVQNFNFASFFTENIFNNSGQYRPFTIFYFSALYSLFELHQFFYHLIQLCLHIINTILVFILFKIFFKKSISFFLAILFLIHPMQVESVSYISASASPLFFLFGISALLICILRKPTAMMLCLQFFLLIGSMLVKETGILFVFFIAIYQLFFNKKYFMVSFMIGSAAVLLYFIVRIFVGEVNFTSRTLIPIAQLSFWERLITLPQVLIYYLKSFVFPANLAINQHWVVTEPTLLEFYVPLLIVILTCILVFSFGFHLYKKKTKNFSVYTFFVIWCIFGLSIHSQIIPLDMTVADRWAYLSIVGALGSLGIWIKYLLKFSILRSKTLMVLAILFILILATRTVDRNYDWRNSMTLWKHDINVENNFLSQLELSHAYIDQKNYNEALIHGKESVQMFPSEVNLYNLGFIYESIGDFQTSKLYYEQAYTSADYVPGPQRHHQVLYLRFSNILLYLGEIEYAKRVVEEGLSDYPDSAQLWIRLAICHYEMGNQSQALAEAQKAKELSPESRTINSVYLNILNKRDIDFSL